MSSLRALFCDHARLTLALMVLALALKAVVPAGFMLAADGERFLTVTICSDATGVPQQMQVAIPHRQSQQDKQAEAADKGRPCAFSGLGHDALGGADPLLLAAALAFILLVGVAPRPALPARDIAFLRPPLRGPPPVSV